MKRFATGYAALALALITMLAACGGSSKSGSTGGGAPDRDGTLTVAFTIPAMALDPHRGASDVGQFPYASLVYDRLTQIDPDGKLAPMVATKWTPGADGLSYTFDLREDVVFSDGTPLDAQAVKLSLDRARDSSSTVARRFTMVTSVDVVDPKTIKITTNRPSADLPHLLAGTAGSIISPAAINNPDLDVKPVGSGPYTLTELKIGDSATFERRDDYWDKDAGLAKKIEIQGLVDDNARMNALRSGQIDFALTKIGQAKEADELGPGFGVHYYPVGSTYALFLNIDKPNLDNVKVRQALNYAVDRKALNTALLSGKCAPNVQPLPPDTPGYLKDPPVSYAYDVKKAKQLLSEAGVEDGFSMTMLVGAGLSPQNKLAPAIQAQFKEIGVDVQIVEQDPYQVNTKWATGGGDSYVQTRGAGTLPAITIKSNYVDKGTFPGTSPPEVLSALDPALDPNVGEAEQTSAIEKVSGLINEQALDVFLCAVPATVVAYSDKVVGADQMGISNYVGIIDLRYVGVSS